jgi:6-pyruvoyl-tetrahydropterin synthase
MYELTKRVMFCAAHSIKGAGKCENKHGHNWEATIKVTLVQGELDERGFIVDVGDLKQAAFKYDHDDLDKYFDFASTENVAKKIAEDALEICLQTNPENKYLVDVHLVETENNSATAKADNVIADHSTQMQYVLEDGMPMHPMPQRPAPGADQSPTLNTIKRIV